MKILFIILIIFFSACSMDNKKNDTGWHSYDNPAADADTSIKPILKIGGCYAYEMAKDSFACFLVFGVTKEDDMIFYSFFTGGDILKELPTKKEFQKNGIWGRKVPMEGGDARLTFDQFSIEEKDLAPVLPKIALIDEIKISYKNEVGSMHVIYSLNEIPESIDLLLTHNKRMKEEPSFFPQYPNEIVSWDNIVLASNASEIPVPTAPWIFSRKTAHPVAVAAFTEDWYWNEGDDISPFGNDGGNDALKLFREWRLDHPNEEPANFIPELESVWGMSFAHMHSDKEEDLEKISRKNPYYSSLDESIIGVAFGQLLLEGKISPTLKELGLKAIRRTEAPFTMKNVREEARDEFRKRLAHMTAVLNRF
jgi:uncharacterized protein YfeS